MKPHIALRSFGWAGTTAVWCVYLYKGSLKPIGMFRTMKKAFTVAANIGGRTRR